MRNLNFSVDGSDLINSFDLRTESTMDTESFSVDDGTNRQVVEYFSAVFPGVGISVFPVDFIIKSINSGNLSEYHKKHTWIHGCL